MHSLRFKNIISFVTAFIGGALIISATFPACVEVSAFNRSFYNSEYKKLNSSAYVGVDENTLINATNVLLDYLLEKRNDLNYKAIIDSEEREYYTQREKAHMIDVLKLNKSALTFIWMAYVAGTALAVFSYIYGIKKYITFKGLFFGILSVTAFFAIIGGFIAIDFNAFWIGFHHVFFTNDLWILDPSQSLMIRMFESKFFFDMSVRILALYLGIICAALIITFILYKKLKANERLHNIRHRNIL